MAPTDRLASCSGDPRAAAAGVRRGLPRFAFDGRLGRLRRQPALGPQPVELEPWRCRGRPLALFLSWSVLLVATDSCVFTDREGEQARTMRTITALTAMILFRIRLVPSPRRGFHDAAEDLVTTHEPHPSVRETLSSCALLRQPMTDALLLFGSAVFPASLGGLPPGAAERLDAAQAAIERVAGAA